MAAITAITGQYAATKAANGPAKKAYAAVPMAIKTDPNSMAAMMAKATYS